MEGSEETAVRTDRNLRSHEFNDQQVLPYRHVTDSCMDIEGAKSDVMVITFC